MSSTKDNTLNIAAFFSALSAVPQLLNLVDQAVVSVEQSLQGIPGAQKSAAAVAKINGWLQVAQVDAAAITSLQGILGGLINAAVAAFNAAQIFHKSTPAA